MAPVALDGSRRVTIVEGPTSDSVHGPVRLIEMRGAGCVAFGGFFEDGARRLPARPRADE